MDRHTVGIYERRAGEWRDARAPTGPEPVDGFLDELAARDGGVVADLGCGPGWHTTRVGSPAVALDAARAMLELVPDAAPDAWRVQASVDALPFRRGALAGGVGSKVYVHLSRKAVPAALADLHHSLVVGARVYLALFEGDQEHGPVPGDDFGDRRFSLWPEAMLRDVLAGAGFEEESWERRGGRRGQFHIVVRRLRTLPDTVGPGMRLLVCGLNPSVYAADAGVGFARPGNRFWPAALASGLVHADRDTFAALHRDRVGMTDLVKRATARADELTADEYRVGLARLERLCAWLEPGAVCLVGLAGWRAAVDTRATAGVQGRQLGRRPVYVMPSTSGANASSQLPDLVEHLRSAMALADAAGR